MLAKRRTGVLLSSSLTESWEGVCGGGWVGREGEEVKCNEPLK